MTHLLLAIIYLAFISLGLPDGLLGSAWPTMYTGFHVPVSYAGIISMIISLGTIVSSLQGNGESDGDQRSYDSRRSFRLFFLRFLLDALPVVDSLWAWGRECRRCSE